MQRPYPIRPNARGLLVRSALMFLGTTLVLPTFGPAGRPGQS